ncbi:MAG TPA: metal-sulfur cluster assembly factor [Candidatus Dormibacteraeota bacterium]|nr:metal-sulfur cluster assembly factor [Candidatus Dormibacteraeota bacterium]
MSDEQAAAVTAEADPVTVDGDGPAAGGGGAASRDEVFEALSQVYDPEIGIDIVNLGLVYDAVVDEAGLLTVDMTLTSPYCPMGAIIQSQAHAVCKDLRGVDDVQVNLVWSPPWDPHTMASDEAKLDLGIY